jgi:hypothetical protein
MVLIAQTGDSDLLGANFSIGVASKSQHVASNVLLLTDNSLAYMQRVVVYGLVVLVAGYVLWLAFSGTPFGKGETVVINSGSASSSDGASSSSGSSGNASSSNEVKLNIVTLLRFDGIPSMENPEFVESDVADDTYDPDELVLGVEINGEIHEFGVSGKLIMNALVMYDRETRSLWSQFLSRAVQGELTGTKLETIPLTLTTWEKWKETQPETVALRKSRRGGDPYDSYYFSRSAGVIGESNKDNRLPTKELVLGLGFDTDPIAFPHSQLRSEKLVHTSHAGTSAIVYFDPATDTALAFGAVVSGQELSFELIEKGGREWLKDDQTGTLWIPFTGQSYEGELIGNTLERLHAVNAFWFAWTDFYPDTDVWGLG